MVQPRCPTVDEVVSFLEDKEGRTSHETYPVSGLRMNKEGHLQAGEHDYRVAPECRQPLVKLIRLDFGTYLRCPLPLRADLFNCFLALECQGAEAGGNVTLAVEQNACVTGLFRKRLDMVSASDILTEVVNQTRLSVRNAGEILAPLFSQKQGVNIRLVIPNHRVECRPSDFVEGALDVHLTGEAFQAVRISGGLHRPCCDNGFLLCLSDDDGKRRIRHGKGTDRAKLLAAVRLATELAWQNVAVAFEALTKMTEFRVESPRRAFEEIEHAYRLQFSAGDHQALLDALDADEMPPKGAEAFLSRFDLANALSRHATYAKGRPLGWQRQMLFAAGDYVMTMGRRRAV